MELHGKIAVVTGAASGLGLATCKVLAAAGVRIAGFDRDEKKLQALKSNLGDACLARVVDVAEDELLEVVVVVAAVDRVLQLGELGAGDAREDLGEALGGRLGQIVEGGERRLAEVGGGGPVGADQHGWTPLGPSAARRWWGDSQDEQP